jgi:hypothetical protein
MSDATYIFNLAGCSPATTSGSESDSIGKLVIEAILEAKAEAILQIIHGLRGNLQVTFQEGTCAAWLYALPKAQVTRALVPDVRKNAPIAN